MSGPRSATVLAEVARQLRDVFAAAAAMVAEAEKENRRREEATRRTAEVLGKADRASARRVMAARRAASAAELRATHTLADELRYQAGARALAAVHRYAGTLAAAAEELNQRRRAELDSLGHSVGLVDQAGALALLRVVREAEERRSLSARQQADAISEQIKAAIGVLPAPPVTEESPAPRRRRRRRTRQAKGHPQDRSEVQPAGNGSGAESDVVHLDPSRRRRAN